MVESWVDVWVDMLCVKLFDESDPTEPGYTTVGQQISVFGEKEVALVTNKRGIGVEKSESDFVKLPSLTFHGLGIIIIESTCALAGVLTTQIFCPNSRFEQEARKWFDVDLSRCPYKMHIHRFCNDDLSAPGELIMERAGRHGGTCYPEPSVYSVQTLDVEF